MATKRLTMSKTKEILRHKWALGVRPDLAGPVDHPLGRPFHVGPMRLRHVLGVRGEAALVAAAHVR